MLKRAVGRLFVISGAVHFVVPQSYIAMMPRYLPAHRELVYASGVAEIAGGVGLMHPRTRCWAGWWLIATLVAVFPANLNMALNLKELRMWARVARFEGDPGTVDAAIEEMRAFAASGEVPPELAGAKVLMLVDRQSGGRLAVTMFGTEEAMHKGDAAMNAGQPRNAGRRSSVELYEVAGELTL
jgi:uncharacterized membrane protein